ncbi:MAG: hypothetical protein IJX60_02000 [Paludibacteraceae bacterium]|nr:hypothetical protein [Paludibacteraceae bacterium]
MKKIMFNDKYGLTQAVLDGSKTMTRRIIHAENIPDDPEYGYAPNIDACCVFNEDDVVAKSQYNLCEVVAIAQAYKDIYEKRGFDMHDPFTFVGDSAGWTNKMFVKADLMPHHIKITNICVERLQEISDEDCLREGVRLWEDADPEYKLNPLGKLYEIAGRWDGYKSPREAFAALIDKVSGRGTWDSNPLVWVYKFELVD